MERSLKNRGFQGTLHTIRRALITPSSKGDRCGKIIINLVRSTAVSYAERGRAGIMDANDRTSTAQRISAIICMHPPSPKTKPGAETMYDTFCTAIPLAASTSTKYARPMGIEKDINKFRRRHWYLHMCHITARTIRVTVVKLETVPWTARATVRYSYLHQIRSIAHTSPTCGLACTSASPPPHTVHRTRLCIACLLPVTVASLPDTQCRHSLAAV
jgi:hypothetical protein